MLEPEKAPVAAVSVVGATGVSEKLKGRETKELVIAFSGPVGSGIPAVVVDTEKLLRDEFGYDVYHIKLSSLIQELSTARGNPISPADAADKYIKYQDAGNDLRKNFEHDILSQVAISKIAIRRVSADPSAEVDALVPKRVAYIVDQLKHPDEVALLRSIYGNMFFLVGVLAGAAQRGERLKDQGISASLADEIMARDKRQNLPYGQKLESTLKLADFFIRNRLTKSDSISQHIRRFLSLMHGQNGVTPSQHEYGMYVAYSAGLKSSCLSRQVGAAIASYDGVIISTGCNDAPRSGGGLYSDADGTHDYRCFNERAGAACANDQQKNFLVKEITKVLEQHGIDGDAANELALEIKGSTRLKDLIEFSRSVHAEMDAIVNAAREGKEGILGGVLYTTTFPCHSCARHIVAAGVSQVYYVEPYEKSMAIELHKDAIDADSDDEFDGGKVRFIHFEGVAPRRYQDFFEPRRPRKDAEGKAIFYSTVDVDKVVPQYLDSYKDMETKVTQHLVSVGLLASEEAGRAG